MNETIAKPWYREPWAWFVLAPLIAVFGVCYVLVSTALRYADDTVSDTYYKDSRMYHYRAYQDDRARELELAAMLQFQSEQGTVTLDLVGDLDYPPQLLLTLSHPVEADFDQHIPLTRVDAGRYRGEARHALKHRWYLQLMPEMDPRKHFDAEWRLKGEINFAQGDSVPLKPGTL